eukprot:TRINITY_DN63634_c0_g1_i2.p1 TRINITY_DN63634_c0_g1~~TRINITY_DN63634_c0_g1_i2.p1  ORF type:complete len:797 (-),score=144.14 TRINITY_DN63634_c0_g1_i2:185-2575(-)
MECFRDCYLYQHVMKPTHHPPGQRPSLIDLVFTDEQHVVEDLSYEAPWGKSYHSCLCFSLVCFTQANKPGPAKYLFHKADMEEMKTVFGNVDWRAKMSDLSCEDTWAFLHSQLNAGIEKCVPKFTPRVGNQGRKRPGWMSDEVLAKVKEKQKTFKRYMNSKDGRDYRAYARARNQAKWVCRKAVRDYERTIALESKNNPRSFFRYARSKTKVKTGVSELKDIDGTTVSSDKSKAEILNKYFCTVFTQEDTDNVPNFEDRAFDNTLEEINITPELVWEKLFALDPKKAMGPDDIPPLILKECSHELALPISILMQKSINEGVVPKLWRQANVTPIFKKGKKNDPGNYRPVSLTCVICKVMESIVRDHLVEHFTVNKLLSKYQHGFVKGRSCTTNLVTMLKLWTDVIEKGGEIDTVYLDFAKAFDTVPHVRLLRKLYGYGVRGQVLCWVEKFLADRKQRVTVNGSASEFGDVMSGIPQGSVLGPMLFLCFINDLPETVESMILIFADDTKLSSSVPDRVNVLQKDLDNLQEWSETWKLKFNASKCKVMHLGKQEDPHKYSMNAGNATVGLESCSVEKDLGVHFDDELKFRIHVDIKVEKASNLLNMIRRNFVSLDIVSLPVLYKTLIRPLLEYGNVAWDVRLKKDQRLLESIQHRATKMIPQLNKLAYEERLRALKIPTLYYRRARGDMIECFKYLTGLYQVPDVDKLLERDSNTKTRGHSKKLKKNRVESTCQRNFFAVRVVNAWNSLPESVVSAPTLSSFKARLDRVWARHMYIESAEWFADSTRVKNAISSPRGK